MTEPTRGLLDTSVVIDHDVIDPQLLPDESAISAVTLAELAAGPHATDKSDERARRQDRLQWATATWDPIPFDDEGARVYGRMFAAARAAGQSERHVEACLQSMATRSLYTGLGGQSGENDLFDAMRVQLLFETCPVERVKHTVTSMCT
jgi:predicted nucleic acid-binding protein